MSYAVIFTQSNRNFQAHILKMGGLGKYMEHSLKTIGCYDRIDVHPNKLATLEDATKLVIGRGYIKATSDSKYIFNYSRNTSHIKTVKVRKA